MFLDTREKLVADTEFSKVSTTFRRFPSRFTTETSAKRCCSKLLNCSSFTKQEAPLVVFRYHDVKIHAILPYGVQIGAFTSSVLISLKR